VASTADLSPFALLLLTSVARSPSCVGALPRTLDLLAERLAVQSPANEQSIVARMGTAFAALASLADVHVKMPTSPSRNSDTLAQIASDAKQVSFSDHSLCAVAFTFSGSCLLCDLQSVKRSCPRC
jgi:hypothetical protein